MSAWLLLHLTYGQYQRETHAGQIPREACTAASRAYHLAYRKRTGRNHKTGCSPGLGWPHADPALARILAVTR